MELTPERITIIGFLLGIISAGAKKIWVWGYQLKEANERAQKWESIALRLLKVTEKIAEKDPNVPN